MTRVLWETGGQGIAAAVDNYQSLTRLPLPSLNTRKRNIITCLKINQT
jgi:hypothetical protein